MNCCMEIYRYINFIKLVIKSNIGYVRAKKMGVPQTRHRVFFIAVRGDIDYDLHKLDMCFNYKPVTYGEIKDNNGADLKTGSQQQKALLLATPSDRSIGDVLKKHF